MVEATIYIPIVVFTVLAFIELALFNLQEFMLMYEAQRVCTIVAKEVAYTGYDRLGVGKNNEIDFESFPSDEQIVDYYEAHNEDLESLYREVLALFHKRGKSGSDYASNFSDAASKYSLIAIGIVSAPDIKIDNGLFGSSITVTFTHEMPVPGVLRYFGYKGNIVLKEVAYTYAVNPSQFVRNLDLAADMTTFLCKKLGISDKYESLKKGISTILDIIL